MNKDRVGASKGCGDRNDLLPEIRASGESCPKNHQIRKRATILFLGFALASAQAAPSKDKTDAEIKQLLIQESRDKAGKSCGVRSAYSKPGALPRRVLSGT